MKQELIIVGGRLYGKNPSKNFKVLWDFVVFCSKHPELRFWQALYAWVKQDITVGGEDPFYWEDKLK